MIEGSVPSCTDCTNKNRLFCGLNPNIKDHFSQNKVENYYKRGQVIFYEGNYPNGLHCIFNGKVKISKIGQDGKEQIIKFAGKGDSLGYRALMNHETHNATATAIEESRICHISSNAFISMLEQNHCLSFNMIKQLSSDLNDSERKLLNLSQKPVKDRVAEALLILKKHFGFREDGKTLDVTITRREIGEIAGITTETAIRTLSEFNKEKIISLKDKKIIILDMRALTDLTNS